MLIDRRLVAQFDFLLMGLALIIPLAGLVVLYSAGYDAGEEGAVSAWLPWLARSPAFSRQLLFITLGIGVMLVGVCLTPSALGRIAYVAYPLCILLLVLVDLFGHVVKGSQRWLSVGGFNLQPAELAKLALILALGKYISRATLRPGGFNLLDLLLPLFMVALPGGLILIQPDLGTSMVIFAVGFSMILFVGVRPRVLIALVLPVMVAAYPAWHKLHPYQKKRILVLVNPEVDPKGSGYHINQSKIAVGSGALFGKGYMRGTQTQLEFLPEHTTDFIFSVLAEEWGFAGCMTVLALYLALIFRLLRIVARSRDLFSTVVSFGIAALVFVHVIINIGMVIGLLPVVGLPLPLFSYGGSAVVACMFALGVVLGLDARRTLFAGRMMERAIG